MTGGKFTDTEWRWIDFGAPPAKLCGDGCECLSCVPSPAGWDAYAASTGFTGEKKDARGRRICYANGKRVACPKKEAPAKGKAGVQPAPMAGHPLDGKTRDEVVQELIDKGSHTQRDSNPWGLEAKDPAGVVPGVVAAVQDARAKNSFARPTVRQLYDSVGAPAGLSVRQFQDALLAGQQAGALRLGPYTQALGAAAEADLRFMVPLDREKKFYVDLGAAPAAKPGGTKQAPAAPAGFTGEKKDARGRRICYANGKRVACPKKPGAAKEAPAGAAPAKAPGAPPAAAPGGALAAADPAALGAAVVDARLYASRLAGRGYGDNSALWTQIRGVVPGATDDDVRGLLEHLDKSRAIEFHSINEKGLLTDAERVKYAMYRDPADPTSGKEVFQVRDPAKVKVAVEEYVRRKAAPAAKAPAAPAGKPPTPPKAPAAKKPPAARRPRKTPPKRPGRHAEDGPPQPAP